MLQRAIEQIKSRVDPQTWSAFWNIAVLNQHTSDVADALGMTTAAVRKAESRTIQRLRKQLGDREELIARWWYHLANRLKHRDHYVQCHIKNPS